MENVRLACSGPKKIKSAYDSSKTYRKQRLTSGNNYSRRDFLKLTLGGVATVAVGMVGSNISIPKPVKIKDKMSWVLSDSNVNEYFKEISKIQILYVRDFFSDYEDIKLSDALVKLEKSVRILSLYENMVICQVPEKVPCSFVLGLNESDICEIIREYMGDIPSDYRKALEDVLGQVRYYHRDFFEKNAASILEKALKDLLKSYGCRLFELFPDDFDRVSISGKSYDGVQGLYLDDGCIDYVIDGFSGIPHDCLERIYQIQENHSLDLKDADNVFNELKCGLLCDIYLDGNYIRQGEIAEKISIKKNKLG